MLPSITVPSNLWQAWNVCHPPDKAGRTQYFPHRLRKKKKKLFKEERENELFDKALSSERSPSLL